MSPNVAAFTLARIAVEAGGVIAMIRQRQPEISRKADGSPVTDADLASEHLILQRLASVFPGLAVVSEESLSRGQVGDLGRGFILVHPLDGTREFIGGRSEYTVNLALIEGGRPRSAAIYAPALKTLWLAGKRSFRLQIPPGFSLPPFSKADPITVRPPQTKGLVALVSRSHLDGATETYLDGLQIRERRPLGSSLKFCIIAQGEADIYPRLAPTHEWDTAAGHAILVAAGGAVRTPDGTPLTYGHVEHGFRQTGFIATGGQTAKLAATA